MGKKPKITFLPSSRRSSPSPADYFGQDTSLCAYVLE